MSTKDPHVALIDAHEKLDFIKQGVKKAVQKVIAKRQRGEVLTEDDRLMIRAIRQQAIDSARRVQDELFEELKGHGLELRDS